ncbi:MAG: hypothetical protein CML16_15625 [Pusillimonas sp.]|uniref:Uncharacterized protein n=1 Tax=Neopusillimonas maritima TaxID=2026239 RepID=A0A3A1YTP0_9BURK|nr:hypothetical protein [Neopusillimonas maritima]MAO52294.1 hypothetical protein [Pusillimonas sp.]MBC42500.1 hypothetical protein [Pusillimonas sp.]RIY39784.1 hypothetical protein CJP73_13165 [Neopusillimonas maritima]HCN72442.1 hypothetical protein [Pusillimonas sp.]HCP78288.1 hypothetical protein [Pusillimonas sp.]
MLKGKELGRAIERAIQLKIDAGLVKSRAAVARDLHVEPNVVYGWIRTGSISKERLPELWIYFDDVVNPEHWGLSKADVDYFSKKSRVNDKWPFELTQLEDVLSLSQQQLQQLDHILAGVLMGLRSKPPMTEAPPVKSKKRGRSAA